MQPRPPSGTPPSSLARWPVALLVYVLLCIVVVLYATTLDRTFLLDQQNYVDNFVDSATLDWFRSLLDQRSVITGLIIQAVSEEILWRVWTTALGVMFDPTTAVVLTVCALNLLVIASAWQTARPSLAMALWITVPVGFAVIGLLQLRQGFAFALMLYCALRLRRPILGTVIGAMVHTTFALALVFAGIARLFRFNRILALAATLALAFGAAYSGSVLFEMFGGRRLATYSVEEGATSINYVFGGLLCILPSLYWLLTSSGEQEDQYGRVFSSLALIHVGVTLFTIFSFFIFPLGAGRVGYLTQLMLIPMLPAMRLRETRAVGLGVLSIILIYLVYLAGKSYLDGTYDIYFGT